MNWKLTCALVALACAQLHAPVASACGGFFCSASPVDQSAERILFAIDEASGTTDMIVQINYQGQDQDFAWVLPVGAVPQNREVFPPSALSSLDAQSGPTFQPPSECRTFELPRSASGVGTLDSGTAAVARDAGVTVHVMETVDSFDVAVIESESAEASYQWLLDNHYRLSSAMKPYLELYTSLHMKFLALKLTAEASTKDIKPFKMTLPGTTPTVPLRLTAIAAEPEMGVVVWVLGQRRYEPANAEEITIPSEELRWQPYSFPVRTNWTQLVARHVDARGGRAWVVEQAGSSEPLLQLAESSFVSTPDQTKARDALVKVLTGRPYLTRLYTRVAAEEMTYDPIFKASDKGDVPRERKLPFIEELCSRDATMPTIHPCDFASCGQLGLCREAMNTQTKTKVAACACAPGTTARNTFDPQGAPTVSCQDQRLSFMNPGERDEGGATFSDPCVGFSCGEHGKCIAMNLTPTCACEEGYVALARSASASGVRQTECVQPQQAVPKSFYNRRPPALAAGMVAGREVVLPPASADADVTMPDRYGDPMPMPSGAGAAPKEEGDGCSTAPTSDTRGLGLLAGLLGVALYLVRRRRA